MRSYMSPAPYVTPSPLNNIIIAWGPCWQEKPLPIQRLLVLLQSHPPGDLLAVRCRQRLGALHVRKQHVHVTRAQDGHLAYLLHRALQVVLAVAGDAEPILQPLRKAVPAAEAGGQGAGARALIRPPRGAVQDEVAPGVRFQQQHRMADHHEECLRPGDGHTESLHIRQQRANGGAALGGVLLVPQRRDAREGGRDEHHAGLLTLEVVDSPAAHSP
mmetsp:Transcript_18069/g.47133  ORF Transcript_18069/g.47133 Transcript_18069/m.47133 type:complete len:216 (-) Transcript_18069:3337-3984(-)